MAKLTWLVTGCSSDVGERSVNAVLARGNNVIATARDDTERLKHLEEAGATVVELDLTAPQATIDVKINDMLQIFGGIDVLVNNAGYIEAGVVEEIRLKTTNHQIFLRHFQTNTFGIINTTRAILPHSWGKKFGVVVFIGSSGGWAGEPGAGPYCETKSTFEGIFECLRQETAHLGLRSIIFELGIFRTKIMHHKNLKILPPAIDDYAEVTKAVKEFVVRMDGNQPGDTKKQQKS